MKKTRFMLLALIAAVLCGCGETPVDNSIPAEFDRPMAEVLTELATITPEQAQERAAAYATVIARQERVLEQLRGELFKVRVPEINGEEARQVTAKRDALAAKIAELREIKAKFDEVAAQATAAE